MSRRPVSVPAARVRVCYDRVAARNFRSGARERPHVNNGSNLSSSRSPRSLPRWIAMPLLVALALLTLMVLSYSILRGATYSNDFKNPYRVARVFWQTGRLDIKSEPRYPPTARVLLAPLAALPIGTAATVWALASIAAIAALPRLLERLTGIPRRAQLVAWLVVLPYLIDAVVLGQSDPINLFLVTTGLVLARDARDVLGAGLIGLAGMLKVLPVLFWAVLASRRRWRGALLGAAATAVAGLALLTMFSGWSAGLHSVDEWWTGLGETEGPWGLIAERNSLRENNESLPVVLARTFGDIDPALARNQLSLARLPLRAIWAAWLAVLAAITVVWLACAWRADRAPPERGWLGMFALTAVLMLAATPVAWPHYFLWLLPAALFSSDRPRLLIALAIAGQLGMMIPVLRGLGCHMLIALLLFGLVARDLLKVAPTSDPRRERARLLSQT
jgi:glycosyl transferase family 87